MQVSQQIVTEVRVGIEQATALALGDELMEQRLQELAFADLGAPDDIEVGVERRQWQPALAQVQGAVGAEEQLWAASAEHRVEAIGRGSPL